MLARALFTDAVAFAKTVCACEKSLSQQKRKNHNDIT